MRNTWPQIDLPAGLGTAEGLTAINGIISGRRYASGQIIYNVGDKADALHIIEEGQVTLSVFSLDGKEKILEILHHGDIFGEMFLDEKDRGQQQARAITDVLVSIVTRRAFLELCRHTPHGVPRRSIDRLGGPQVVAALMGALMKRLRNLQREVEDLAFSTARERFIKWLGKLCDEYETTKDRDPQTCIVRFSQDELAHLLGLTRERVNALIQEFKGEGLVQSHYGYVTVNRDQLQRYLHQYLV
jgi:CRP/FNR family transcriptional regulator